MFLFVDETRILPITVPTTRQVHIGQGTFLECLKIGASGLGFEAKIELFPEGEYSIKETGKKPVAKVTLSPSKKSSDPMYDFLKTRRTVRAIYGGSYIGDEEFTQILNASGQKYSEQITFNKVDDIARIAKHSQEAMKIEVLNVRTGDETRNWFRFNDKEIQEKRDGLALPDQAVTGMQRWVLETFLMGPEPEKFHNKTGLQQFLSAYEKKISSAKGFIIWKTKTNNLKDWVQTGFDYVRFQLALTKFGLVMHPMSQILQEYVEMDSLRKDFEREMNTKGKEKLQMIARLGRSDYQYFTPRRDIRKMIV